MNVVAWYVTYEYRPRKDCMWAKRDDCELFKSDMEEYILLLKQYPAMYRNISEPIPLVRGDKSE